MNIEELTKSQIFLLTLLTSFVTSMATGIATISLIDQAPPTITQTVSRVIQSTVEKTAPDKSSQPVAAAVAVPLQKNPVADPLKAPDLSSVVKSTLPSIVRLYDAGQGGMFLGYGVVLDARGTIVTDYDLFGTQKQNASVMLADGALLKASVFANDAKNGLVFLSSEASSTVSFVPAVLAKEAPSIGDTVIGISGKTTARIASGLLVALPVPDTSKVAIPTTDINTALIGSGEPIINTSGAIVGISTAVSRAIDPAAFTPASILSDEYTISLKTKATGTQSP